MAKVGEHESHDERKQELKAGRQHGPTLITVCLSGAGTGEGGAGDGGRKQETRERWRILNGGGRTSA